MWMVSLTKACGSGMRNLLCQQCSYSQCQSSCQKELLSHLAEFPVKCCLFGLPHVKPPVLYEAETFQSSGGSAALQREVQVSTIPVSFSVRGSRSAQLSPRWSQLARGSPKWKPVCPLEGTLPAPGELQLLRAWCPHHPQHNGNTLRAAQPVPAATGHSSGTTIVLPGHKFSQMHMGMNTNAHGHKVSGSLLF